MILKLFKQSYLLQYAMLFFLAILLWFPAFVNPPELEISNQPYISPLWHLVSGILAGYPMTGVVIAFLLTLTGALFINAILDKYDLVPKNTLIPAALYIIMMSHQPDYLQLHPETIAAFLMLIVLFSLFDIYTQHEAYNQVFNTGFLSGIASLFFFPSALFLLFIYLTFFAYRLYTWREWFIALSGFLINWFFLASYYFLFDKITDAYISYSVFSIITSDISSFHLSDVVTNIISGLVVVFFMYAASMLALHLQENVISVRKRFVSVFWFIFISLIMSLLFKDALLQGFRFLLVGIVIFVSWAILKSKNRIWFEWFIWILILFIVGNNIYQIMIERYFYA
ncbi:MAG: hypothetical protein KDC05_00750 [Bacteroidales bacterium]|nr:hypothetical protein [Bacteroidales bacterium]